MLVKRLVTPQEPFTDDGAGSGYFATDLHYRRIAATICDRLSATSGFVLLTDETAPDGELIAACLNVDTPAGFRATLVQCRPGMGFEEIVRLYSQQLGLAADDEGGNLWPLISHLMLESRKEIVRILVLENAEVLDDQALNELYRFAKVDDPRLLPILLVAPSSFAKRIEAPGLAFLKFAIVAHLPVHRLESDEVPAFIQFQMNAVESTDGGAFPTESVEAITIAANGDPEIVNCLAREALAFRRRRAAMAQPGGTDVERQAEALSHALPQLDSIAVEPAPEMVLSELSALPQKGEGLPPRTDEVERAGPEAEAAPPVADEPAAAVASRLLDTPPPKPRRVGMGLAAVAYLLVALVSGSTLLYLLVPRGDKTAASAVADAVVPQTEIKVEPLTATDTPDEASLEGIAKRFAPIEPSTAPPEAPAETASAEPPPPPPPPPPNDVSVTTEPMATPSAPAAEAVAALLPEARPTPAARPVEVAPAPAPPAESAAAAPPVSTAPAAPSLPPAAPSVIAEATPPSLPPAAPSAIAEVTPPSLPPAAPAAVAEATPPSPSPAPPQPQPSSSATPNASAVPAAVPSPQPAAAPAAPPVRVANLEPSVAAPPRAVDRPPSAETAVLIRRGDQLLAAGDIVSARRFYERAAAAGEASASLGLAKSYDPLYLQQSGARGVSGNPANAALWYRKAAEAGNAEASSLLGRLLARYPQ